jgi:4-hydroxy-tetrahydrodipicolinate reductase
MPTNICVVGATGKFGSSIIKQAGADLNISGAVTSDSNRLIGKRLSETGLHASNVIVRGASEIEDAAKESDVVLFVSKPDADLSNIPKVVELGKRVVVETTGFTESQSERLNSLLNKVPSVFASNFVVGANIMFQIAYLVSRFNALYDFSIVEQHHKHKVDAPSGTAKTIFQLLNTNSTFQTTVTDRTIKPKRMPGEVEVVSLRSGETPGIHQLILSGEHDMIRIEHIAFSRIAGAAGALLACRWIASRNKAGIYSMQDVLGLTSS